MLVHYVHKLSTPIATRPPNCKWRQLVQVQVFRKDPLKIFLTQMKSNMWLPLTIVLKIKAIVAVAAFRVGPGLVRAGGD